MNQSTASGEAVSNSGADPTAPDPKISTVDYQQTVGYINLLTDVRFKLAAFVPALTGAAVALLSSADVGPLVQTLFGSGGLAVALGIVVYDRRNSQLYNGAIGRAMALEKELGFPRLGGDRGFGLFGSRSDTTDAHEAKGNDRFLGVPVRHGTGLALVYTATLTAWVWVILDALADALAGAGWDVDWELAARDLDWELAARDLDWELAARDARWQLAEWLLADRLFHWVAASLALASAALIWRAAGDEDHPGDRPPAVLIHLSEAESEALDRLVRRRRSSRQEVLHDAIATSFKDELTGRQPVVQFEGEADQAVPMRLLPAELAALTPWTERCDARVRTALIAYMRECSDASPADQERADRPQVPSTADGVDP